MELFYNLKNILPLQLTNCITFWNIYVFQIQKIIECNSDMHLCGLDFKDNLAKSSYSLSILLNL